MYTEIETLEIMVDLYESRAIECLAAARYYAMVSDEDAHEGFIAQADDYWDRYLAANAELVRRC